ncbi:bifunctional 2-polyprenyl-6-hydroxyphenol methylase/3-demethylubiquinol 3-O-methyltransferase UbiG [Bdellovibrio sp. KM01]|uniref:class I SAM-dependent methyltransferase n=1 Tax=Bdellovibrio sp. KM01 TaxID=2748865 RepID=UPI0015E9CEDF|nr:class I SAM-dependent methyltransferase [Bdellovibrio sp. KM01]QLY26672.1 methyltransferase domain-containing protein [Bdellovibrio sp. KM01]
MSENRKNAHNVQDGYDIWAAHYDHYPNPTVATDEMGFPNFWCHHSGKKVLEIGCGTGRHTKKWLEAGNSVTAIDISPKMLAVARGKIPSSQVNFVEGDFLLQKDLPHDFDILVESLMLEHIQDLSAFFKQCVSVLKTGGDLYLSEIHPERTQAGIGAHFKVQDSEMEIHLVSFAHTENEIVSWGDKTGFKLVNSKDLLGDKKLSELNPKWERHMNRPMVRIWHFVKR